MRNVLEMGPFEFSLNVGNNIIQIVMDTKGAQDQAMYDLILLGHFIARTSNSLSHLTFYRTIRERKE